MEADGPVGDVRARDIWRRNSDGTHVLVELVFDSWYPQDGRLVQWIDIGRPRENVCTERSFLRRYTIVAREETRLQ